MTATHYVLRSLLHYRFAYLGVLAGAVLGAMVLLGALFAGDSVQYSLRQIGRNRTGQATHLLTAGDRFFRVALADDLARAARVRTSPIVYARGTAGNAATQTATNQVQLIGVTDAFWQFAPRPARVALDSATPSVAINDTLARRLRIGAGGTLIVRMQKPGILAGDAPIAGAAGRTQSLRCTVAAVIGDAAFGRFSLETTQVAPSTAFLPIQVLQEIVGQPARANVLLIDASAASGNSASDLSDALRAATRLADYGLSLDWREQAAMFELTSRRIFIDPEIADAVIKAVPTAQPVVSYLINEFTRGERATPYSIATATTRSAATFLPPDLGPRDIVLNTWLAEDLGASVGDEVGMKYYRAGATGALDEQSATFHVRAVVPLQGLAADRSWMPDFPGISDAKRQGDWDSGLPLNLDRIRSKDEKYWDSYRGAPKAFLAFETGRELWSTRWGNTTALRLPFDRGAEAELTQTLLRALRPELNHLSLQNFAANADAAARSPVDFGGLFVGMSFFLIAAALGLVAMLFQFCLLQRNREDALLGAVGLPARQLLRWRLAEASAILLLACVIGLALATVYTRGILRFLESIWAGADAGRTFVFAAQPESIVAGSVGFLGVSLLAIWLAIRRQTRRALSIRLAAHAEEIAPPAQVRRSSLIIAGGATAIGAAAVGLSGRVLPVQGAFYLAGFALLAAGIATCRWWTARFPITRANRLLTAGDLGTANLKARRSRSLTVVGLIATAVFMVLSVASFRKHIGADWLERGSGTGGFAFWIETTSPINPARNARSGGFEIFEPHAGALGEIVPLRVGLGDNANCFNLNTVTQPRLLAVDAAKFAARNGFNPKLAPSRSRDQSGWSGLRTRNARGALPAFVDETTLLWALKRKVGDVFRYADEHGRPFDVEIVGTLPDSIFQGYLIVDEPLFREKFPSSAGYSVFLADARDATPGALAALRSRLELATRDFGGRVDVTRDVLASFHQIENTYIAIFNVLGSLGVILGSLGLAVVVARNLHERRGEFAVMTAMGIPRRVLARIVFSEFARLMLWGVSIGAVASAIAVGPNLTTLPAAATLLLVAGLLAGIVVLNLASGWAIFRWALRDLRPGLAQAAL